MRPRRTPHTTSLAWCLESKIRDKHTETDHAKTILAHQEGSSKFDNKNAVTSAARVA